MPRCTSCNARVITEIIGRERRVLLWNWNASCFALPASPIKRNTNEARQATNSNTPNRAFCVDRLEENPNPKRSLFKSQKDSSICMRWAYTATMACALKCASLGLAANSQGSRWALAFFKLCFDRTR